jgi:hypothetical protein
VVELEVALLGVVLMSPARYEPNHIWTQRRRGELTVANDPELRRRAVRRLNLEAAYRGQAARRRGAETSRSVKISRSAGTGDSLADTPCSERRRRQPRVKTRSAPALSSG